MKTINKNGIETVGENVHFERIRRVTGYLVGTLDRFNNAKTAEVHDRVKHGVCLTKSINLEKFSA